MTSSRLCCSGLYKQQACYTWPGSKALSLQGWAQACLGLWCCCAGNWPEKCPNAWQPICLAGGLWDSPVFSVALHYPLVRAMAVSGIWATFSIMETRDSFCLSIVVTIKSCSHRAGWTGLEVVIQRNFCLPTPWVGPDGGIVLGVEREEWS